MTRALAGVSDLGSTPCWIVQNAAVVVEPSRTGCTTDLTRFPRPDRGAKSHRLLAVSLRKAAMQSYEQSLIVGVDKRVVRCGAVEVMGSRPSHLMIRPFLVL